MNLLVLQKTNNNNKNLTTMDEQPMSETFIIFSSILCTGNSELNCSLAQKVDHV